MVPINLDFLGAGVDLLREGHHDRGSPQRQGPAGGQPGGQTPAGDGLERQSEAAYSSIHF